MADTTNLSTFLSDVANAIREKKGTEEQIPAANFDTEIKNIQTGVLTQEEYNTCLGLTNSVLYGNDIGYKVMDYIQNEGDAWISIDDFIPTNDTKYFLEISEIEKRNDVGLMGAVTRWAENQVLLYLTGGSANPNLYWAYNRHQLIYGGSELANRHKLELYRGTVKLDDEVLHRDDTNRNRSIEVPLTLFHTVNNYSKMKLHSCKLYEGDVIKRNLLPVLDELTEEYCLYDLITKRFYRNSGSGEFIGGVA